MAVQWHCLVNEEVMKNAGNYKVKELFNPSIARQGKREIVKKDWIHINYESNELILIKMQGT